MAALHKTHNQFDPLVLQATVEFMEAGPWAGSMGERVEKFQRWWNEVHRIYGLDSCPIVIAANHHDLQRYINSGEVLMVMQTLSVIAMFSTFRHGLVDMGRVEPIGLHEEDAYTWACSLWYNARPASFRHSVRKGLIPGVTPADLVGADDRGAEGALTDEQQAAFEALAEDAMDSLSADPEIAALLEQFNS